MHTIAWLSWIGLVMGVSLTTTNPYALAIVLLCILLVNVLAPRTGTAVAGFRSLLILGVGLCVISVAVAVVNGNYGSHVLFTIPGPHIPDWLGGLRIGGPVSAEGLIAAAVRGMSILCVFLAFAVFNGAVSPHRVLRTTPAALFHAGLVVTVGLTLLPSSIEDVRRIREMRALRGAGTGVRNLPALVVPAVIGGLERSMRLAEAMEARGYGTAPPQSRATRLSGAMAAPLLLGAASVWYYYFSARPLAAVLAAAGVASLAAWVWSAAHARHTTSLRNEPLPPIDALLAPASLAVALFAIAAASTGWVSVKYNPFAELAWPTFSIGGALLALACGWPALRLAFAAIDPAAAESGTVRDVTPAEHFS
jgi:energy-coupling factor transport system permease protein